MPIPQFEGETDGGIYQADGIGEDGFRRVGFLG